ncbi:MAG: preprotein translocase subunit SecE [Actinomycetaceae bacterium]|nr:preprotein translocase subunit SecE [Actinomycetaceae bacterium]
MAASSSATNEDKRGIFSRIVLFVRQIIAELKKVHWPTRDELWTYFGVVIVFVLSLMVIVGVFDFVFMWLARLIFG